MKKHLLAALHKEIDPLTLLSICLVIGAVIVLGKIFTDRILTVDDYAMDGTEMSLPAL